MKKPGYHRMLHSHERATRSRRSYGVAWIVAGAIACLSGCTVYQSARRTLIEEPSQFSWRVDRGRSLKAYRQWAEEAWAVERGACPEIEVEGDYALGFRDGFVDFVYAGGPGEPPPVPPQKFWNLGWRNPEGDSGAQQWFAGYRHGAQVARDGGYRTGGIVRSAYAGTNLPAWTAMPSELEGISDGAPPELVPAPGGTPPTTPEILQDDEHNLPTPPAPATPEDAPENSPETEPADDSSIFDEPLDGPAAGNPGGVDDSAASSSDLNTTASKPQPSIQPPARTASAMFRRAVASARDVNAASANP